MSEPIAFRDIKLEGGWLMVKPEREDLGKAMAMVRKHRDKVYSLEIRERKKKRSLDANAYAWVLIHKLATAMHISPEEVYLQQIPNVGNNYTIMCVMEKDVERFRQTWSRQGLGWPVKDLGVSQVKGCRNLMAYHGSSTYDTAQMGRLIDLLVQDCKALDIETLTPDKLALLKEEWK